MVINTKSLENKQIRNLGLILGSVSGGSAVVYFLILYFTGAKLYDPFYKFDFWVTVPLIIVSIFYIRKAQNSLRVWQGLLLGFYIVAICSSVSALFNYVFLTFIDVDFMAESLADRLALIQTFIDKYEDPEAIKHYKEIYDNTVLMGESAIPLDIAKDKIIWHYIVGLIVTFITSVLLRK